MGIGPPNQFGIARDFLEAIEDRVLPLFPGPRETKRLFSGVRKAGVVLEKHVIVALVADDYDILQDVVRIAGY